MVSPEIQNTSSQSTVSKYLSLVKFSHTIFALPFALLGFVLGMNQSNDRFDSVILVCVVLCMVFARSAAMGFNRYLDREYDAQNPRTQNREIPAGAISPRNALTFVIINCILFITTTYFINTICFFLSPIALFVILFYSYTKRFTALCHLVLGVGLGLAPIGAYLAVTGQFHFLPIILSFAVFTWTAGFDIIYALQDDDFDKGIQLHSIPGLLGRKKALQVSNLLHLMTISLLIAFGLLGEMNWIYWIGFGIFAGLLVYQHLIVKPNDLSKVNLAFGTTNGVASVIFATVSIISIIF